MHPLSPRDVQADRVTENRACLALMVVATLVLGWILVPFYGAIL